MQPELRTGGEGHPLSAARATYRRGGAPLSAARATYRRGRGTHDAGELTHMYYSAARVHRRTRYVGMHA